MAYHEDPQITTTGTLKESSAGGEIITFSIYLALFELVCIVNVPPDGTDQAPVYIKFKTRRPQPRQDRENRNYERRNRNYELEDEDQD
jgi:hypothetical protein